MISPSQRSLITQRTTKTTDKIHVLSGMRTRNPNNQPSADLCLRPHGHWNQLHFELFPLIGMVLHISLFQLKCGLTWKSAILTLTTFEIKWLFSEILIFPVHDIKIIYNLHVRDYNLSLSWIKVSVRLRTSLILTVPGNSLLSSIAAATRQLISWKQR